MRVYVLIMIDRDMRPRNDMIATEVFSERKDALAAMEQEIANAIENGQTCDCEIERSSHADYAVSSDCRFIWKVEERIVCGGDK